MTSFGAHVRTVWIVAASTNPGRTSRSASNVRTINTAPTTSTSASATCATTSVLRVALRWRLALAPRMIIFGAVDFTAALTRVAKVLGYRVTVCDARAVFATVQRFPFADEVVNDWPDRYLAKVGDELGPRDAICVLTHDHKFDVPAIAAAVKTNVGYLGAMGSRRTHESRVERLREAGVADAEIARVQSPIGLDIGARTPEETAISICSEIIARRTGRHARSLRDTAGPIH